MKRFVTGARSLPYTKSILAYFLTKCYHAPVWASFAQRYRAARRRAEKEVRDFTWISRFRVWNAMAYVLNSKVISNSKSRAYDHISHYYFKKYTNHSYSVRRHTRHARINGDCSFHFQASLQKREYNRLSSLLRWLNLNNDSWLWLLWLLWLRGTARLRNAMYSRTCWVSRRCTGVWVRDLLLDGLSSCLR